jgi:hypothetical protein
MSVETWTKAGRLLQSPNTGHSLQITSQTTISEGVSAPSSLKDSPVPQDNGGFIVNKLPENLLPIAGEQPPTNIIQRT